MAEYGAQFKPRQWSARELRTLIERVMKGGDSETGTCLLCNQAMSEHPPERVLVADSELCPTAVDAGERT